MKRTVTAAMALTAIAALSPFLASSAYAQHRERAFAHPAPRYETPHWAFDDRFHHDHFYPAPGYAVGVLPAGRLAVNFGGGRFFFHAGVWYRQAGAEFVVVRPPLGIVLPVLPPAYTPVWIAGAPYYYANDIYYSAVPGGYAVAQPPMDPSAPPQAAATPPQATAAPGPAGSSYVPAPPPQAR